MMSPLGLDRSVSPTIKRKTAKSSVDHARSYHDDPNSLFVSDDESDSNSDHSDSDQALAKHKRLQNKRTVVEESFDEESEFG